MNPKPSYNTFNLQNDLDAPRRFDDTLPRSVDYANQGSSAAPLLLFGPEADASVQADQERFRETMDATTRAVFSERGFSPEAVEWAALMIDSRLQQREGMNTNSYLSRLNDKPDYSYYEQRGVYRNEVDARCLRAKHGVGSFVDVRTAQIVYGMPSAEYGNLTLFEHDREEDEAKLWQRVSLFTQTETDVLLSGEPRYKLMSLPHGMLAKDAKPEDQLLRVGKKQHLKALDGEFETTLKLRETAIFDLRLVPEFVQELRSLLPQDFDAFDRAIQERVAPLLARYYPLLVGAQQDVAKNVTIYGSSRVFDEAVRKKRGHDAPIKQEITPDMQKSIDRIKELAGISLKSL